MIRRKSDPYTCQTFFDLRLLPTTASTFKSCSNSALNLLTFNLPPNQRPQRRKVAAPLSSPTPHFYKCTEAFFRSLSLGKELLNLYRPFHASTRKSQLLRRRRRLRSSSSCLRSSSSCCCPIHLSAALRGASSSPLWARVATKRAAWNWSINIRDECVQMHS
jgi:hypothetical protein